MEKRKCKGCGKLLPAYRIGISGYCPTCKKKMKQQKKKKGGMQ